MAMTVQPVAKPVSRHVTEQRTTPPTPPATPPASEPEELSMANMGNALQKAADSDPPPQSLRRASQPSQTPPPATPPASEGPAKEAVAEAEEGEGEESAAEQPAPTDLEAMLDSRGKPKTETPAKPAEQQPETPTTEQQPIPSGPKALREALARERERVANAEKRLKELETKATESKALTERLEALQKAADEAETKLRVLNYEQSGEYAEKWQKPMERTWSEARKFVSELQVDDGQGGKRQATAADFDALISMNTGQATDRAYELFGRAAERVLSRRDKLIEISQGAQAALAEWRDKGAAFSKQQQAEMVAARERINTMWNEALEQSTKKYPQLFGPKEGDTEGNKLLAAGVKDADEAMGDLSALAPEQRVAIHARIRNRAAAWPREVYLRQQAEAKIKELEAELAEYKSSKPGKGEGRKPGSAVEQETTQASDDSMESLLSRIGQLGV